MYYLRKMIKTIMYCILISILKSGFLILSHCFRLNGRQIQNPKDKVYIGLTSYRDREVLAYSPKNRFRYRRFSIKLDKCRSLVISKQKETKMKLNLRFIIYSHPCPKKNVGLLVGLHLVEFSLIYLKN